jgi:hypothetical protein
MDAGVRQPGERVVKCQMRDPRLVLCALGNVLVGRNPAAVLRRPVRNVDDAAVVELGDEVVGSSSVHPARRQSGASLHILT